MPSLPPAVCAYRRTHSWRKLVFTSLTVLVSAGATLLSGCGMGKMDSLPSGGDSTVVASGVQGHVHGGQQPVSGSVLQLYVAGKTGYGLGSTSLLTSTVTTDANGNFTLPTYTCPTGDGETYITATGGNPGLNPPSTNNTALVLMSALGSCDALQANSSTTFIDIDEVSTVAAAFALAQFSTPNASGTGISMGSSPANALGLSNAFATVNNLVNPSNGTALSITPAYAANPTQYFNISTAPQARINTLADILASCVNTSGPGSTNCSTLFTAATPPGGTAPVDTAQAALDIALNPGNNVATLYGLSSATGPFQPTLSTTPTDFVLALTFTGGGLGLPPMDAGGLMTNTGLVIDANNNIWVTAYNGGATNGSNPGGMLAEFNNLGAPLTPASVQTTPSTVTFGGYPTTPASNPGLAFRQPGSIAFDQFGTAWVTDDTGSKGLEAYNAQGQPAYSPVQDDGTSVGQLAIDASGNVWGASVAAATLFEFSGSTGVQTGAFTGGGSYGSNYYGAPFNPVFDSSGNLWMSDNQFGDLYLVNSQTGQLTHDYFPSTGNPTAITATSGGNIIACPTSPTSFQVFNAANLSGPVTTFPHTTGRGCSGIPPVVDGFGNLWNFDSGIGVDVYTSTGALLSPVTTGYTTSSFGEPGTITSYPSATGSPTQVAVEQAGIDGSGNVWVLTGGTSFDNGAFNSVVELVGAAGPVVTPISAALANNQIAARP